MALLCLITAVYYIIAEEERRCVRLDMRNEVTPNGVKILYKMTVKAYVQLQTS